jgi:prolyl-tRNA editing enzyme YbaK/EbsC (Cys-tRNA(Pro) deacylase)
MDEINLDPSAAKVQMILRQMGYTGQVQQLEASTRTAEEAASACGCDIGQIVKSLIFNLSPTHHPVLILVSGANRVNEKYLGNQLGGKLERANPEFVRQVTGFAIGGIPPVGHSMSLPTYIDEDLLSYSLVWAAAGTPHAVFPIAPSELVSFTHGTVMRIKSF